MNDMSLLLLKNKKSQLAARSPSAGFTLIEVLITIAMISIFIPAVYSVYAIMSRSMTTQGVVADVQQSVRFSLDFMVQDIRMAGLDPLSSSGASIEQATATKIRFTADLDMNGAIDAPLNEERVTYLLDTVNNQLDQILYEGTGSQNTQALIENVTALAFTYLDETDTVTATLADIRTVVISLTSQAPAGQQGMISRTFNGRVRGRNL